MSTVLLAATTADTQLCAFVETTLKAGKVVAQTLFSRQRRCVPLSVSFRTPLNSSDVVSRMTARSRVCRHNLSGVHR